MATNFEFYKERIIEIVSNDDLAVSKDGAMGLCNEMDCENCIFYREEGGTCKTPEEIMEFLYAEHVEQPKLTKRERAFCEAVQTGWIARDGKYLYWHIVQPIKDGDAFVFPLSKDGVPMVIKTKGITFDVIKNKEMMGVEDLLKLDVVEAHHETD